jgi:AcrR family transcriptional regulator
MARKIVPAKVDEAKEKIISASIDLIISEGFSKFTLSNVAAKVGITKAAIYWYFPSKEEILNVMASSLRTTFIDSAKRIAEQPISPKQKIEALILSLEKSATHKKCFLLIKVFLELYSTDNGIKNIIQKGYKEYLEIIRSIFVEAMENNELRTTISEATLAKLFCAALDGCVIQDELMGGPRLNYKEVRDFYLSVFVEGEESTL